MEIGDLKRVDSERFGMIFVRVYGRVKRGVCKRDREIERERRKKFEKG